MSRVSDLKDEVLSIVDQLSHDELRVFRFMGRRMIDIGHVKYGALDLKRMNRVWSKEMAQETADRRFYAECEEIAREDARAERLFCFKHDVAYERVDGALQAFVSPEAEDRACPDCLGVGGHRHLCPWTTQVTP